MPFPALSLKRQSCLEERPEKLLCQCPGARLRVDSFVLEARSMGRGAVVAFFVQKDPEVHLLPARYCLALALKSFLMPSTAGSGLGPHHSITQLTPVVLIVSSGSALGKLR